jgi:anti-sigma-K factor RskA
MTHVIDDLELYAVGALPDERARDVVRHLDACPECRLVAAALDDTVSRLPEAITPREPPSGLKGRILAAAGADARPRGLPLRLPRLSGDPRLFVMAATIVLLLAIGGERTWQATRATNEIAVYEAMANDFAHGGRTWYMAGVDQWKGMGGNLMQPASGDPAFVLFHDLRGLPDGQVYALWLISPDGKWVRGTTFRPDGRELQLVTVGQELAGFERCAVTVEQSPSGKREGPIVMQSRIAPPPSP